MQCAPHVLTHDLTKLAHPSSRFPCLKSFYFYFAHFYATLEIELKAELVTRMHLVFEIKSFQNAI